MANVYKPKNARKKNHRLPPGWGYLIVGLVIGLGIGLAAYLFQTRFNQPVPTQAVSEPPATKKPQKKQDTPQKPEKSLFDFYTLLPEMEVVIPETDEPSNSGQHPAKTDTPEAYVLQTGSFRRFDEADGLKANLALIGISANIQTVAINGEDTWYRVRIGPYKDFNQLRQVRTRLKQNDIEFIVLKMRLDDDK